MIKQYEEFGFFLIKDFWLEEELIKIEPILHDFHEKWKKANESFYASSALNSHSLTSSDLLNQEQKDILFDFIASKKISSTIPFENARFLNTQLFFDPVNPEQKNYWHRDIQYNDYDEQKQKELIQILNIVHFRIPLRPEKGIELIAGTHRSWDDQESYEVRLAKNGRQPSDSLSKGKTIALERRDLLVFSANMVHRAHYGNNRFSLDLLFYEEHTEVSKYR